MDLVGHQIGAYRILSLLGRGGTAEVYKAFHPALKREVALKVLLQEVSHDVDWVRRFHQEAQLLAGLDHPHILPVYDGGEHEGRPFLVMKYMADGSTLRTQLSGQPWPLNKVVKVVTQVSDALDAAHGAGVVHRDIKPSNILVTPELRCLVFDFGIAKPFRREEVTTGSGLVVGTPEFMSPEQCKGEKIDRRCDIYSLGVMTYQMLTGHVPFTGETAVGILMKHLTEPLPIPPKGVALPPSVNGVLRKAMAREPRERFATAGEFGEAFKRSADQRATVTLHASEIRRAATPTLKLPHWVRRVKGREFRMAMAGGLLLAMTAGLYALWPPPATTVPPPPPAVAIKPPAADESNGADKPVPVENGTSSAPATIESSSPPSRTASPTTLPAPELGHLHIEANEAAKVLLNGQPIGVAPGVFESVEPGRYTVALDAGGGRLHEQTVVVTAGSTHHLRFDFSKTPVDITGGSVMTHQSAGTGTPTGPPGERHGLDEPPPVREWTGYLTDSKCRETGGKQGELHLRCVEVCLREGRQPMLYSRGKLYRLEGVERLDLARAGPLRFKGWLDLDTIHVVEPEL